jgi:hypothetical protein
MLVLVLVHHLLVLVLLLPVLVLILLPVILLLLPVVLLLLLLVLVHHLLPCVNAAFHSWHPYAERKKEHSLVRVTQTELNVASIQRNPSSLQLAGGRQDPPTSILSMLILVKEQ